MRRQVLGVAFGSDNRSSKACATKISNRPSSASSRKSTPTTLNAANEDGLRTPSRCIVMQAGHHSVRAQGSEMSEDAEFSDGPCSPAQNTRIYWRRHGTCGAY